MKKLSLILILCCIICKTETAQEKVQTNYLFPVKPALKKIYFNFSSKENPTLNICGIKKGDYYQVIINNINLNLYKVLLTSVDTVLSKPITTPIFGNFDLAELLKVIPGIASSVTSAAPTSADSSKVGAKSKKGKSSLLPINLVEQNIIRKMIKEKDTLFKTQKSLEQIAFRIDTLKYVVYTKKLNSLKIENPKEPENITEGVLSEIERIRKEIYISIDSTIVHKKNYEVVSINNGEAIANIPYLTTNDKAIKESYDTLLKSFSDVLNSISAEKTYDFLSQIVLVENNSGNTYTSLPIQFTGEQAKVSLTITPRDEKYNLQSYHTRIVFPQNSRDLILVGVSLYISGLYDETYSAVEMRQNSTPLYIIRKEMNGSRAELGVAALVRKSKILDDELNIGGHLSLGTGMSISNTAKPRFLIGGGLSIGDKNKVAVDVGVIAGYVDRFSSVYYHSRIFDEKPDNLTVSRLSTGLFFSVGYAYQF
jgi:hypothetical protein